MNIVIALIPAVMWGIMPLVVSKIGGKPRQQIIGTTFGALAFAIGVFYFLQIQNIQQPLLLLVLFQGHFGA